MQFAFGVMTRAKAITYDNLRLRAPAFVAKVDRVFARKVKDLGFDVDVRSPSVPMFQPFRLREMMVPNGWSSPRWTCIRPGRRAGRLASRALRFPRQQAARGSSSPR